MNKQTNTLFRLFITAAVLVVGFSVHTTPADARSRYHTQMTQPNVSFSPTGYIITAPIDNNQYQYGANDLNYGYNYPTEQQPSYYSQNYLNQNITTNINSNNTYSPYQAYSPYPTTSQYYPTTNYNNYSPITYPIIPPVPTYIDPNNYQYQQQQQTYTDPNAYTNYNTNTNVTNNQTGYGNTF